MASNIRDEDKGWKALLERMAEATKSPVVVSVGIHEADDELHDGSDETLLEIAEKHEFGLGVPRRSFIADWADEAEAENKKLLSRLAKEVVLGEKGLEEGLDLLGLHWVGEIQKRIKAHIDPPLSPATVKAKGSSTPLIDTGQLWGAIRHEIYRR